MVDCPPCESAVIVRHPKFLQDPAQQEGRMAKVDVVVPCYGYGRFLRECVESVLSQSLRSVRVLIIDDASPDESADIARALARDDSRVAFVQHKSNRGHIATYNEGIEWASADYLLLLSADDHLLPGALARAATLMDAHPEVGFTFGRCIELYPGNPDPSSRIAEGPHRWKIFTGMEFIERSGPLDIVATATAVVRTDLQKQLGGYRAELPHAGDMEMWLRFALHGSVGFVDADQAVYRRHENNMSLNFIGGLPDLQQRKAVLDCVFATPTEGWPDLPQLHRKLVRALAVDAASYASQAFNRGEIAECERILEYAVMLSPAVRRSQPWRRLVWKRRMGRRLWSTLYLVRAQLRHYAPSL
jgi:GT2 family glycosyltransferase